MKESSPKNTPVKRPAIDWEEIRQRIHNAQTATEHLNNPEKEQGKAVLKQRAKMLAEEHKTIEVDNSFEVIEFVLAHERYAFESGHVREVCPLREISPVPCTPVFVLGIINVRGRIVSVIDLKKFFDLPEKGLGDLNKVIILRSRDMEFGILADVIKGVRTIRQADMQAGMTTLTGLREEYLKGITPEGLIVLDAVKLLEDKNIIVDEQVEL